MKKAAHISECGKYRYFLERVWDETLPVVGFIMLNPSTADAENDDPTIRRCMGFARSWGYGGIMVVNLYGWRSTEPKALLGVLDPMGNSNEKAISYASRKCEKMVCAWGNAPIVEKLMKRYVNYRPLKGARNLQYIELGNSGHPKHPLYLLGALEMKAYGSVFSSMKLG